jgi:hypothetical protein
MSTNSKHIDQLAAIIREVQGTRRMGAAALAKAILSCPASQWLLGNPPAAPGRGGGGVSDHTTWADVAMNLVFLIPTCLLIWSLRR